MERNQNFQFKPVLRAKSRGLTLLKLLNLLLKACNLIEQFPFRRLDTAQERRSSGSRVEVQNPGAVVDNGFLGVSRPPKMTNEVSH